MTQFLEGEMKLIIFQEKNIKEVENMSSWIVMKGWKRAWTPAPFQNLRQNGMCVCLSLAGDRTQDFAHALGISALPLSCAPAQDKMILLAEFCLPFSKHSIFCSTVPKPREF